MKEVNDRSEKLQKRFLRCIIHFFVLNRKSGHFDEPDDIDKVGGRIMLTLSRKIVVNIGDN